MVCVTHRDHEGQSARRLGRHATINANSAERVSIGGSSKVSPSLGRELVMRKVHIRAAFGRAYAVAPISASMWVGTFTSIALFMRRTARQGVAGRVDPIRHGPRSL